VRPAGREPQEHVAGGDARTVEDGLALHGSDREPGQVVFAFRIHVGHLGRLTANQRTAGEFAAARDSAHYPRRHLDVSLPQAK